jgi:hypothetical protein
MQEMNARRRDLVQSAQRTLVTALGEMEANAALVIALGNPRDHVQVSLGKTSIEDAIKQARAIGLDRGDYQIDRVGAPTLMKVTGAGIDKLAKPIAKADLQRTKTAMDIIEGRKDEDRWLPQGVADRPDMAMNIPPGTAPQLAKPFRKQPKDMSQAVEDFIGQRAADGASPADISSPCCRKTPCRPAVIALRSWPRSTASPRFTGRTADDPGGDAPGGL